MMAEHIKIIKKEDGFVVKKGERTLKFMENLKLPQDAKENILIESSEILSNCVIPNGTVGNTTGVWLCAKR